MKFVLIIVLYMMDPSEPPAIMYKAFNSSEQCQAAKKIVLDRELPKGLGGGAICVSEQELLSHNIT